MTKEEFVFTDAELQPAAETITLTRAEIDALTVYADMVRREMIRKVFDDVEELLQMRYRFENKRGGICEDEYDRCRHFYGRNVCESLLIDLLQIKKRYADETDKV